MAVIGHQVKDTSDVPSLQHSESITVLPWLSSFVFSQEQLWKERTGLSFYGVVTWVDRVWFAVSAPRAVFPSVPGWARVVWDHGCQPGDWQLQTEVPRWKHLQRRCLSGRNVWKPSTVKGVYIAVLLTHTSICQAHRDASDHGIME